LPKKRAVIGICNTLRRDDGIGIIILESLLKFYKREDTDYLDFGSASFDLLNRLSDYDTALIIDSIDAGFAVGELKIGRLEDIGYRLEDSAASTHGLNLKDVFELSKRLGIKTRIYVAGIQAGDTSFKEGLSEGLREKKEDIIKAVAAFIDKTF
jgi:hydrogenase maturation protease